MATRGITEHKTLIIVLRLHQERRHQAVSRQNCMTHKYEKQGKAKVRWCAAVLKGRAGSKPRCIDPHLDLDLGSPMVWQY